MTGSNGSFGESRRSGAVVRWVLGLATAAMIVWLAVRYWDDLRQIDLQVDAVGLLGAVVVSMAATWCLALGWRELIGGYGTPLAQRPALRIWMLSQATRYLPTGLVPIAARAALAAPLGVNRAAAGASVIVETATLVGWSAVFAALWAPTDWLGTAGGWLTRIVIGAGAAIGLVTLPWTLAGAGAWWRRIDALVRRAAALRWLSGRLHPDALSAERTTVWRATFVYGLAVAQRLMAAVLLAGALLAAGVDDIWLIAGATAAGIVGRHGRDHASRARRARSGGSGPAGRALRGGRRSRVRHRRAHPGVRPRTGAAAACRGGRSSQTGKGRQRLQR